jgi:hypothetical protein
MTRRQRFEGASRVLECAVARQSIGDALDNYSLPAGGFKYRYRADQQLLTATEKHGGNQGAGVPYELSMSSTADGGFANRPVRLTYGTPSFARPATHSSSRTSI